MWEKNECRILVGKQKEEETTRRPRHRWVDNIEMDLTQDGVVWTRFIWLRIRTSGNEPSTSIKCWEVVE
jgi:hypothetical protein